MNGRAFLVSPLGFLIGVSLGALGGGGSILAVPVLVYAAGENPKVATTTSLVVVGLTAAGGMVAHFRAGRVRLVAGGLFGLAGIGGSLLGTQWNRAVDENVLLLAFAGLMVVAAWRMCRRQCWFVADIDPGSVTVGEVGSATSSAACAATDDPAGAPAAVAVLAPPAAPSTRVDAGVVIRVLLAGSVVGLVTGFFGVGGGFVIVPALVLALRFPMAEAVGTSLLVIVVNSAVALAGRAATTGIDWAVAAPFTLAGLLGVSVGKRLADRVPTATLARWFVGLLVAVAAYVAIRAGLSMRAG